MALPTAYDICVPRDDVLQGLINESELIADLMHLTQVLRNAWIRKEFWCPGRESNPHGASHQGILSPLRLPIPPPGQT